MGDAVACEMEALYVYCIVPGLQEFNFGPVGLDMCEVCAIPGPAISAIVHGCPAQPYQSKDRATVEKWVAAQHRVVETAWERFGAVLPMSFDMIVSGNDSTSAHDNLIKWMQEKRNAFTRQLERLTDKAEYGVQIFWNPKVIADDIIQSDPDFQEMQREIDAKSAGLAYLWRGKLEKAVKERMEARAQEYFRAFYDRIHSCVQDIRVERPRKTEDDTQMLLNVSCLVEKGDHGRLGRVLDQIAEIKGIKVRFTGPWPPYSFVSAG